MPAPGPGGGSQVGAWFGAGGVWPVGSADLRQRMDVNLAVEGRCLPDFPGEQGHGGGGRQISDVSLSVLQF